MGRTRFSGPVKSTGGFEIGTAASGFTAETNTTVADSSGNLFQAGTQINATAAEMNQVADVSTRIVSMGATGGVATTSEGRIINITQAGAANTAVTLTLPEATGSGAIYRFLVTVTNTGGAVVAALTTDTFVGFVTMLDLDSNAATAYTAAGTDDKITMNSTTTGGQIGDWLEFVDFVDTKWQVKGCLSVPTGSNVADPFSAS
jgi:hypothetical protein